MELKSSYHKINLREKIITEAAKIISQCGIENLSMRKLSQELDISRTAAYHYFGNKDQLLQAVAETGFNKLRDRFMTAKNHPQHNTLDVLKKICHAYISFALDETEFFRLMFTKRVKRYFHFSKTSPSLQDFEFSSQASFALFQEFYVFIENAKIKSKDPLFIANTMFAHVHGIAMLAINNQLKLVGPLDDFIDQSVEIVFSTF